MIQSILDNDLYKFTMQQAVCRLYPWARVEYELTNRGFTPFPKGFARAAQKQIDKMAALSLGPDQKTWLARACPFFTPDYLDFLSAYSFNPDQVFFEQKGDQISVQVKGSWAQTILWEVPLMAIISETYFAMTGPDTQTRSGIRQKNRAKAKLLAENGVTFVDFGTRRRFSADNHDHLIQDILSVSGHTLAGTSNVHLARKFGISPVGTLAHEWIMFHAAQGGYRAANALALDAWTAVYQGVLDIALTDTYTTDDFLKAFTGKRAKNFTGVRQDSGDPLEFARKLLAHYQGLNIDPTGKTIVFSDGLDVDRALAIHKFCRGRIRDTYGIGTNLTNDLGAVPLNIVIKLSQCTPGPDKAPQPTVKLSDDPGKHTGNKDEIIRCMEALGLARVP